MINLTKHVLQKESLLHGNHLRLYVITVDDWDPSVPAIAECMKGTQTITIGEHLIHMEYNCPLSTFKTKKPSQEDIASLPHVYFLRENSFRLTLR